MAAQPSYITLIISILLLTVLSACNKEKTQPSTLLSTPSLNCNLSISIDNNPSGILTALPSGANEPYTYEWSTGESSSSIEYQSEDEYSVIVTDTEECSAEASIYVSAPDPCISFTASIVEAPSGTFTANTLNGTGPYIYEWSTGENTMSITDTLLIELSVLISDATGCQDEGIYIIGEEDCPGFDATMAAVPPGSVSVVVTTGDPPYTYLWSTGESSESLPAPNGGSFQAVVTDGNGCSLSLFYEF